MFFLNKFYRKMAVQKLKTYNWWRLLYPAILIAVLSIEVSFKPVTKNYFIPFDSLFTKTKNERWALKSSDTYILNGISSTAYLCIDKLGHYRYRIDRCGLCGLSAGSLKFMNDSLFELSSDSIQTIQFIKTFKAPKHFTYISIDNSELNDWQYVLRSATIRQIFIEDDEN